MLKFSNFARGEKGTLTLLYILGRKLKYKKIKFRMFYFFGVKGVIRSYRSAHELKADSLTPA